jgi:hypothetical protein
LVAFFIPTFIIIFIINQIFYGGCIAAYCLAAAFPKVFFISLIISLILSKLNSNDFSDKSNNSHSLYYKNEYQHPQKIENTNLIKQEPDLEDKKNLVIEALVNDSLTYEQLRLISDHKYRYGFDSNESNLVKLKLEQAKSEKYSTNKATEKYIQPSINETVHINAVDFVNYADKNIEIWSKLEGVKINHLKYGNGKILQVKQREYNIPLIYLYFDTKGDVIFNSDSFKSGNSTIEIVQTLYLLISKEREPLKNLSEAKKIDNPPQKNHSSLYTQSKKLKTHKKRFTHCYNCKSSLNNQAGTECEKCGWIRCHSCRACGCGFSRRY